MITFAIKRSRLAADETTPVRLYRQLQAYFSPAVLLESNNFSQAKESHSIIAVDPLIEIRVQQGQLIRTYYPDAKETAQPFTTAEMLPAFEAELQAVRYEEDPGPIAGFLGFTSFDAYRFTEPDLRHVGEHETLPDLHYFHFRFILIFDHFHEHIDLVEFIAPGQASRSTELLALFDQTVPQQQTFTVKGGEQSDLSDKAFERLVSKAKAHCKRGDTFQLVLSRGYEQAFQGDDFAVYRQLRRLNPSPYCFYFDFGPFRMFGASPEALLTVKNARASMRPIAGTYGITGDKTVDDANAKRLLADPKENAEHRMLVDLARNDLSRSCYPVRVDFLRSVERYSHLMHIVSQVSGEINTDKSAYSIYSECFPAGTLSGAPKFKAVELIYEHEGKPRGAYGGGLGYINPVGGFDHCIIIRSAVVLGNTLHYRAGAGIVAASDEISERKEVTHKTNAIRRAIELANDNSLTKRPSARARPKFQITL